MLLLLLFVLTIMGCVSGQDRDEEDDEDEDVEEKGVVEITDDEREDGDVEVD